METEQYSKPPIVEAVVELTFGAETRDATIKRFVRELNKSHPKTDEVYDLTVSIDDKSNAQNPKADVKQQLGQRRLFSADGTDVIFVSATKLGTARKAPYSGWDELARRVRNNYAIMRKLAGHRKVTRLATRYINRIDIPNPSKEPVETNDYVFIEPAVPKVFPLLGGFNIRYVGLIPDMSMQCNVIGSTVKSPIIDHESVVLDIDLYKDKDLPQREDELWEVLEVLHMKKNEIFESFITEKARSLFSHA